mmetsp:Transcript_44190/g.136397  ORF Transcript_44190/g.136397 Transcript_44190/m.136397 type:complete len:251 (-) Transcript_44190:235-987(-)
MNSGLSNATQHTHESSLVSMKPQHVSGKNAAMTGRKIVKPTQTSQHSSVTPLLRLRYSVVYGVTPFSQRMPVLAIFSIRPMKQSGHARQSRHDAGSSRHPNSDDDHGRRRVRGPNAGGSLLTPWKLAACDSRSAPLAKRSRITSPHTGLSGPRGIWHWYTPKSTRWALLSSPPRVSLSIPTRRYRYIRRQCSGYSHAAGGKRLRSTLASLPSTSGSGGGANGGPTAIAAPSSPTGRPSTGPAHWGVPSDA